MNLEVLTILIIVDICIPYNIDQGSYILRHKQFLHQCYL